ncbi:MAG TPA: hypothetical protein VFU04_04665 [Solirubrobacterales bacterium]|nr:hypothetical protein [Solirubrobacterales bacterium]
MLRLRRVLPILCVLALLGGSAPPAPGNDGSPASASAAKKGKRKCPKGKVLKTVTIKRNGKKVRVKRCRKARKAAPKPGPAPSPGAQSLFEPPGRKLEGNDALPFLQRYLANSTFTDCPAGWPNCAVEERYSHFGDGSFYYCRLTPTSGSDIRSSQSYQVQNAVVEADGSWTFNEAVSGGGFYEWRVATNGQVVGAYSFEGGAPEQLGPLQYVSGGRDCSY